MAEKYPSVNGAWPEGDLPELTAQEAVSAARRLYRFIMKRPFRGEVVATTGNRFTWTYRGQLRVNPKRTRALHPGWHDMVHLLSHLCHRKLHPGHKPHDKRGTHAWIERQMIEHVVNSGWLEGKLKRPEKTKVEIDLQDKRQRQVLAGIARWEAKQRRVKNALKKLYRRQKYYERQAIAQ
jgi:hypothetical protein